VRVGKAGDDSYNPADPTVVQAGGRTTRTVAVTFAAIMLVGLATARAAAYQNTAEPSTTIRASQVEYGVKLTLSMARMHYPGNALVPVTVSAANVSGHPLDLLDEQCLLANPRAEVLNRLGRVVFDLPISPLNPAPCPFPEPQLFPRGGLVGARQYVVLRASYVRAVVQIWVPNKVVAIKTKPLRVYLRRGIAPTEVLGPSNTSPTYVDVTPNERMHGPLLYTMSARCALPNGIQYYSQVLAWTPARSTRIASGCAKTLEWHLTAGWTGGPAVRLDWHAER
jgi:hypothetical protein